MSKSSVIADIRPAYNYSGLAEAFPAVDPGLDPLGSRVLVQMRTPKKRSAGGLFLPPETREIEAPNTQVAKVIAVGALAFKNRDTGAPWVEGAWCGPGEYVRVPKYGGDRWEVPVTNSDERALFVLFNDMEIIGRITCDPLSVIAYI
jgi:co-chaperonin GroES (HSP10)